MDMSRFDGPGERSFPDRQAARDYVRSQSAALGVLVEIDDEVSDLLIQELRLIALSDRAPRFPPRFVVRDEDLKLLEAIQAGIGASVSALAGLATGSVPAALGGLTVLVTSVALLVLRARKKGCELGRDAVDILTTLSPGPMTAYDLLHSINAKRVPALQLSDDALARALEDLAKKRCDDGVVVSLVVQDARGLWSASPYRNVTWLMPE